MIRNPVLPGFNADPSFLRVGADYYLATSTFAWHPGVAIHHSRDLAHWRLLTHALTRPSQLDLRGDGSSCGVWAPCLRFDQQAGLFTLLYTDVKNNASRFFDLHNRLITAPAIEGPWSDPVALNASGFDPSLLIDDDGRAYIANLEWDFRKGYTHPGAIVLQEYSRTARALVGQPRRIYRGGSSLGCLEGPNLYHVGDWYYLIAAEGGTGYGHSVTVARSRSPWGPYEPDPSNPILTSLAAPFEGRGDDDFLKPHLFNPEIAIQKPGHASIVQTEAGEWYMAHLGARPLLPSQRCVLGRETFLQRCSWTPDGWLRVEDPGRRPRELVAEPLGVRPHVFAPLPTRDEFDSPELPAWYASLRVPLSESWASLSERPGWLRLTGRESLHSLHEQSVIARRIECFAWEAETLLDFAPETFQQMAGLVVMQGNETWYYLRLYRSESLGSPCAGIMLSDRMALDELREHRVALSPGPVRLRAEVRGAQLQFFCAARAGDWMPVGPSLDQTRISDEYDRSFAGAFVGMCCQDMSGRRKPAYFDYFRYAQFESGA
jgi:xylan 1,4-beta-xylosidase